MWFLYFWQSRKKSEFLNFSLITHWNYKPWNFVFVLFAPFCGHITFIGSTVQPATSPSVVSFSVVKSGLKDSGSNDSAESSSMFWVEISPDSSYYKDLIFIALGMLGIPNLDQYREQYPSVVTFELRAQAWFVKMWWWKPYSIKCESNVIGISRRTRTGLNLEPLSSG